MLTGATCAKAFAGSTEARDSTSLPLADSIGRLSMDTWSGAGPFCEEGLEGEVHDERELPPLLVVMIASLVGVEVPLEVEVPAPTGQGAAFAASWVEGGATTDAESGLGLEGPRRARNPPETRAPIVALSAAAASMGRQTLGGCAGGGGTLADKLIGGGIVLGITMRGSGSGGGGGRTVVG